jgi:steroid 5-alpha reductase family enzyme
MDLLVDLLLLLAAWILLARSNSELDEVWALCLRLLSAASLLAVISSERGQPLAIVLLLFALWLPGADRFEKRPRPNRDGRLPPM